MHRRAGRAARADAAATASSTDATGWPSGIARIARIVEKPKPDDAPSTLARGRPLRADAAHLPSCSRTMPPGAGGEIQLTDGIAALLQRRARARATRSTAGATTAAPSSATCRRRVDYGLQHPETRRGFPRATCNVRDCKECLTATQGLGLPARSSDADLPARTR